MRLGETEVNDESSSSSLELYKQAALIEQGMMAITICHPSPHLLLYWALIGWVTIPIHMGQGNLDLVR